MHHIFWDCFYSCVVGLEMLHSEALSFKGPRTLLLVRPYPLLSWNTDWKLATSGAKRQMQFYSLHRMSMISFICRKSLLIRDQAWFVKSQHYGSFANTTFAHSKHEKLRTEPKWGNAWQTHTGYQIRQSHWLSGHWICSLNSKQWQIIRKKYFLDEQNKDCVPTNLCYLTYWLIE